MEMSVTWEQKKTDHGDLENIKKTGVSEDWE